MIRRRGQGAVGMEEESSSDEEDAFAALSRNAKRAKSNDQSAEKHTDEGQQKGSSAPKMALPKPVTSSMKRHHKSNDDRKAKMDALLQELEAEKVKVSREPYRFVPEKKGSFVDPSEEHLTTNIFVGNLAPIITEEDLTQLFLQFGELYSIKIMWPRTPGERSRKRNTGFVCFMRREDAEEAMEACNESDPFNVGRLLMMRWGKNVKRRIQQGGGRNGPKNSKGCSDVHVEDFEEREDFHIDPDEIAIRSDGFPSTIEFEGPHRPADMSKPGKLNAGLHDEDAIHVKRPPDQSRFHSTALDKEASSLERDRDEQRKKDTLRYKEERTQSSELMTGRQIELAKRKGSQRSWEAGTKLSKPDRDRFNWLVRKKLKTSRESICRAMAFCFEKSGAAREVSALLKDTLMEGAPQVTIDTRIARLYLLSDILFNSQQPGVKNAFIYRDALEKMAPDIFGSLGRHGAGQLGRMSLNKLRTAVSSVLGAWTEWSVYNPAFLDELEARFEGKKIEIPTPTAPSSKKVALPLENGSQAEGRDGPRTEVVIKQARGDWTEVADEDEGMGGKTIEAEVSESVTGQIQENNDEDIDGTPIANTNILPTKTNMIASCTADGGSAHQNSDVDGSPIDSDNENLDGDPYDGNDFDGVALGDDSQKNSALVEASDDPNLDGEALDDTDGVFANESSSAYESDLDGEEIDE